MRRSPLLLILLGVVLLISIPALAVLWFWPAPEATPEPGMTVAASTLPAGAVELEIRVEDLEPGETYEVRVPVPDGDGTVTSTGVLGQMHADAEGTGRLETDGATTAVGEVTLLAEMFEAPGRTISVVDASGETVVEMTLVLPPAE